MLSLLLALAVAQAPPVAKRQPALSVLPAGGGSSYVVNDLCGQFSSYLVGNYACLSSSGVGTSGMRDGGTAMNLYAVGSPLLTSKTVVPSGPNGTTVNLVHLDGGSGTAHYYRTDGGEATAGSFSACYCGAVEDFANSPMLFLAVHGAANSYYVNVSAAGTVTWPLYGQDAGFVQVTSAASALTAKARQSVCAVYQAGDVGALDGGMTIYVNGASSGTPSAVAHGRIRNNPHRLVFGSNGAGTASLLPTYASNWLHTETALTAAQVAAYDKACVGNLAGSYGETVTVTRAGTLWCEADDGTLSALPANRPCIARGGALWVQPALTNALATGTARNWTSGWTLTNVTGALNATGKDGTLNSASTLTATANNGTACQTVTTASALRTTSLYLKRVTGTGAVSLARDGTNYTTLNRGYCYAPSGASANIGSSWVRCIVQGTVLNPQICLKLATNTDAVAVDFAQDVAGEMAGAPSLAQATTAATVMSVARPAGVGDTEGCVSARILVPAEYTGAAATYGIVGGDVNNRPAYIASMFSLGMYDGVTAKGLAMSGAFAGRWTQVRTWWSSAASLMGIEGDGLADSDAYDGTITATPLYLGALSTTSQMTGWLGDIQVGASRYGCAPTLPPSQTRILALGDSMSSTGKTHWPGFVVGDAPEQPAVAGVAGDNASQILARWTSTWRARRFPVVVVLGGINDMVAGTSAATAYTSLETIYDQARADGSHLIVVTVLPWKGNAFWTADKQTQTEALNTSIRNYQAAHPSDTTLVDAYALMGDADPAAMLAAYASADLLHPNETGYHFLAHRIQAALP